MVVRLCKLERSLARQDTIDGETHLRADWHQTLSTLPPQRVLSTTHTHLRTRTHTRKHVLWWGEVPNCEVTRRFPFFIFVGFTENAQPLNELLVVFLPSRH